jgi:hypothetical protein
VLAVILGLGFGTGDEGPSLAKLRVSLLCEGESMCSSCLVN